MPSAYLTSADYSQYGVPTSTTIGQITQASSIVDAYLRRPKGIVYLSDTAGNPTAMMAAVPDMIFTLMGGISPGLNVVVTIAPSLANLDMVGQVLVLDVGIPASIEACVVTAAPAKNQVTLASVQFSHLAGATVETGMTLVEEKPLPNKRSVMQVSQVPAVNIISCLGRYAYGRRSDQIGGLYQEMNLLAAVQTFGGPPQWIPVNTSQISLSAVTGEAWIPAGVLLAYYSDVRLYYIAGYTAALIPSPVKMATAQLINSIAGLAGLPSAIKSYRAGDTEIQRWADSYLDTDTKTLLGPYKARLNY